MSKKQNIIKPKTAAIPADLKVYKKLKTSLAIILAAFAFILYAQSISFNYTFDDPYVLKENSITKQGIKGIPAIIKSDYWFGFSDKSFRGPVYRPVPLILFATEWQFFPDNPNLYHLINVLLFALTSWLLFQLLSMLYINIPLSVADGLGIRLLFPFVCTLLYTSHPIHTEVVDNIKSGDELLCFLFGLLSVILFIKTLHVKSIPYLILAGICYFISLASKETGISFLIIIPLLLFVFTKADFKKIATITIVLVFISGIFFLIRYKVLESVPSTNFINSNNSLSFAPDLISQKATAFYVLLRYIFLLIFPHPLSYDYSFNQIPIQSIDNPLSILSILIYFGAGIYAIIKIRKRDSIAFAILFYLLTLVPVSNIFLLIGSNMSERFLYMPSLGFCMLLTFLLIKITSTKTIKPNVKTLREFISTNTILFTIVFVICGLYSIKIFSRNPDWKDSISLNGHDVEVSANSARTHFNWGLTLLNEENNSIKNDLLNHAVKELNTSISIYPNNAEAHLNLADAYMKLKDYPNAIKHYEITNHLYAKPDPIIYHNLGYLYGEIGQFEKALALADSAIKYNPDYPEAYGNKGNIYFKMGDYSDAIPYFQKVIDLNPRKVLAYKMIGRCYMSLHDTINANRYFEKANNRN